MRGSEFSDRLLVALNTLRGFDYGGRPTSMLSQKLRRSMLCQSFVMLGEVASGMHIGSPSI